MFHSSSSLSTRYISREIMCLVYYIQQNMHSCTPDDSIKQHTNQVENLQHPRVIKNIKKRNIWHKPNDEVL